MPFQPLDINCLYLLEYSGTPFQDASFCRARAEVRGATLQDLEGMTSCQNTPHAFLRRFSANEHCVVAVLDGRIVGYEWFCTEVFHVEERYSYKIEVPPDGIYAYDAFILPEHRLAGIWLKFKSLYLRELMHKLRRQRIITMIDWSNRISMNTHLRFGFKLFRRVFVMRVFGKSIFLTRPVQGNKAAVPRRISLADNANTQ